MKKNLILIIALILTFQLIGQDKKYYRVKKRNKVVTLTPYDNSSIVMYRVSGLFSSAKKVEYFDTINAYKVQIPDWLYLRETNNLNVFSGTLPDTNGIENAIAINCFDKKGFVGFDDFKKYIIEDSAYVDSAPKWSVNHKIEQVRDTTLINYNSYIVNNSYRVNKNAESKNYISDYVLLESRKSFIWINFVATSDTRDINLHKFIEFLSLFELIE